MKLSHIVLFALTAASCSNQVSDLSSEPIQQKEQSLEEADQSASVVNEQNDQTFDEKDVLTPVEHDDLSEFLNNGSDIRVETLAVYDQESLKTLGISGDEIEDDQFPLLVELFYDANENSAENTSKLALNDYYSQPSSRMRYVNPYAADGGGFEENAYYESRPRLYNSSIFGSDTESVMSSEVPAPAYFPQGRVRFTQPIAYAGAPDVQQFYYQPQSWNPYVSQYSRGHHAFGMRVSAGFDAGVDHMNQGLHKAGHKIAHAGYHMYDAAAYAGQGIYDGARYAGQKIHNGAHYTGQKIQNGAGHVVQGAGYVAGGVYSGAHHLLSMVRRPIAAKANWWAQRHGY